MTEASATHDPPEESSETGAARIFRTAAILAQHLIRAVRVLALTSAFAGAVLWLLLWWPMPLRAGSLIGAGVTLGLLLTPAAVLGLFYAGLRDLAALPSRLSTHAAQTVEASTDTYHAATESFGFGWGPLRRLLGRIWALRSLFTEHRALLVRYGTLLRFVTPGFLLLVVGAAGAAALLVAGAVIALLAAWGL